MALTAFGAIYIAFVLCLLAWSRASLPAVLMVSAILQAPAVIVLGTADGGLGVTPFNCAIALMGISLAFHAGSGKLGRSLAVPAAFRAWAAFLGFAALCGMILPVIFEGVPVYPLWARGDIPPEPTANALSLSHIAQAINALGVIVGFFYLGSRRDRGETLRMCYLGVVIAIALSLAISAYQRLAWLGFVSLDHGFWGSNPIYNQNFHTPGFGPSFGRSALPFIEPSYASAWFATAAAGLLTHAAYSRSGYWRVSLAAGLACGAAVVNTFGTTGMASFGVFALAFVGYVALRGRKDAAPQAGRVAMLLAAALLVPTAFVLLDYCVLQLPALLPVRDGLDFLAGKLSEVPSGPRVWSSMRALEILGETYGLGVGSGSTRASSYLVSLLANTGLVGFVMFCVAAGLHLRDRWRLARSGMDAHAAAILAATLTCWAGVFVAVPDQNWPVFWAVIYLGAAHSLAPAAAAGASTELPAEDRSGETFRPLG